MMGKRCICMLTAATAASLLLSVGPASAGHRPSSPPMPHAGSPGQESHGATVSADTVTAVVVKSWSACDSTSVVWDQLNANWSAYGSIPISIDYSDPALCGDSFTLADLEASGADVVILDDPAGGGHQFTADEMAAIRTYAGEGHDLVGTYLTFAYQGIDNSALAPVFGLTPNRVWGIHEAIVPTYNMRIRQHRGPAAALYRGIPKSYVSTGYNASQVPADGVWSRNDTRGTLPCCGDAKIIAANADRSAAITVRTQSDYNAVYIANMPEYDGGKQDQQFLYNAIIYPSKG